VSRLLDDLDVSFKPLAFELLARLVEVGIPVLIVNTRRTAAEQAINISTGHSWVKHSKHEDGLAIDLVPYSVFREYGEDSLQWRSDDPIWQKLGTIGEGLGLRWGGRWHPPDSGHFELVTSLVPPGRNPLV
jgi:D-alanyl-D-alanine carboxypeptidase